MATDRDPLNERPRGCAKHTTCKAVVGENGARVWKRACVIRGARRVYVYANVLICGVIDQLVLKELLTGAYCCDTNSLTTDSNQRVS